MNEQPASNALANAKDAPMELEDHTLYYKPSCPYCIKVLRFMQEHDLHVALVDTTNERNAARLIEIGGKRQVPCLVIQGKALYESNDIVAYLAKKLG